MSGSHASKILALFGSTQRSIYPSSSRCQLPQHLILSARARLSPRSNISPSLRKLFSVALGSSWSAAVRIALNSPSTAHALSRAVLERSTSSFKAFRSIPTTKRDLCSLEHIPSLKTFRLLERLSTRGRQKKSLFLYSPGSRAVPAVGRAW